jgi:putative intracellular protease/amidase
MTPPTACPDARGLKRLIDGRLTWPAEAALTAHLEDCAACQERLEQLAASDPFWERTARNLAGSRTRFPSALDRRLNLSAAAPESPAAAPDYTRRRFLVAAGVALLGLGLGAGIAWKWSAGPNPDSGPAGPTAGGTDPGPAEPRRTGVLVVIAPVDFYYPDYVTVRSGLETNGIRVTVASTARPARPSPPAPGAAAGIITADVEPHRHLSVVRGNEYDAVVFCGGAGVTEYTRPGPAATAARRVIADALAARPPVYVTAVGTGPVVLAHADCFRGGVRATCFPFGQPPGTYKAQLVERGADWVPDGIVEAGPLITAQGPEHNMAFVRRLLDRLKPAR